MHQAARHIDALAAVLGGSDGLVSTAGIATHAPAIRRRIVQVCAWLGVSVAGPRISAADGAASAWVVPTREALMIARHTGARAMGRKDPHAD